MQNDPYEKVNLFESSEKKQIRMDLEERLENWKKHML